MSHKQRILEMLQMGPVCGTRFLELYMPRYAAQEKKAASSRE